MEKIELDIWREAPCISGGVGTKEDLKNSIAGFSIPSGSKPYDIQLLLCAAQTDEDTKQRIPCIAIQIEKDDNGAYIGVRFIAGGNGVREPEDIELYEEPNVDFGLYKSSWGTA